MYLIINYDLKQECCVWEANRAITVLLFALLLSVDTVLDCGMSTRYNKTLLLYKLNTVSSGQTCRDCPKVRPYTSRPPHCATGTLLGKMTWESVHLRETWRVWSSPQGTCSVPILMELCFFGFSHFETKTLTTWFFLARPNFRDHWKACFTFL